MARAAANLAGVIVAVVTAVIFWLAVAVAVLNVFAR
jgi:hypothetical protein